jgi:hypothetical protein
MAECLVHSSVLAVLIAVLLVAAAWGATRFTRWMSGQGDRTVVLMAAVAAWTVLFGLLPFLVFALNAKRVTDGIPLGSIEQVIINLTPFTLIFSPFIGFVQGMVVTRPRQKRR